MECDMSHIFISYVHENQKKAEALSQALKNQGIEVWLDRDNIFPGMKWRDAIRQAIQEGAYFIACFSTEYENRNKSYMNEELMLAIDELRQYSFSKPWFIPVLFSECNVPAFSIGGGQTLLDFQWVNLYSDWDLGVQRLLRVVKSDEIKELKKLIDDFGYSYISRLRDSDTPSEAHDRTTAPKQYYLNSVKKLKEVYGVIYDPINLDHS